MTEFDPHHHAHGKGKPHNGGTGGQRGKSNIVECQDCGGQFGNYVNTPNQPHSGSYGLHSGLTSGEALGVTSSSFGNSLYAPTTREGGSCLEIGTRYQNATTTSFGLTLADIYAYDFCDPLANADPNNQTGVFHSLKVLDGNFRATYERDYGDGFPEYTYQTWRNWDGTWSVALYNASLQTWETQYTSRTATLNPQAPTGRGWDIFELHLSLGAQCTFTPPIKTAGTRWYSLATNSWQFLGRFGATYDQSSPADCLNSDDGQGEGFWYILTPTCGDDCSDLSHEWVTTSLPSIYYPPGGGGGCDPEVDCCDDDPSACCDFDPSSCCAFFGDPADCCSSWNDPWGSCCDGGSGFTGGGGGGGCPVIIYSAKRKPQSRRSGAPGTAPPGAVPSSTRPSGLSINGPPLRI